MLENNQKTKKTSFKQWVALFGIFTLTLGVLSISYLSNRNNLQTRSKAQEIQNTNYPWKSAQELIAKGGIPPTQSLLEIDVEYHDSTNPQINILSANKLVNGFIPRWQYASDPQQLHDSDSEQSISTSNDFSIQLLDGSGKSLDKRYFSLSALSAIMEGNGKDHPGHEQLITNYPYTLYLLYQNIARTVQISDLGGRVVVSAAVDNSAGITHTVGSYEQLAAADAYTQGSDIQSQDILTEVTPVPSSPCSVSEDHCLNLLFIGNDFNPDQLASFDNIVNFALRSLTGDSTGGGIQPWKARKTQINYFKTVNIPNDPRYDYVDLECHATPEGNIECTPNNVLDRAQMTQSMWDEAIVIENSPEDLYSTGVRHRSTLEGAHQSYHTLGHLNLSPFRDKTIAHELGHAFAGLADEYITDNSTPPLDNRVYRNCYAGQPPASEWYNHDSNTAVRLGDYRLGCEYSNRYKSAPTSIMGGVLDNVDFFNAPSLLRLNTVFNNTSYLYPLSDTTSPNITINQPGVGILVDNFMTVDVNTSDVSGVNRLEYFLTHNDTGQQDFLYTYYKPRPSTSVRFDVSNLNNYPSGSYTLVVRAYDSILNRRTVGNLIQIIHSCPLVTNSPDQPSLPSPTVCPIGSITPAPTNISIPPNCHGPVDQHTCQSNCVYPEATCDVYNNQFYCCDLPSPTPTRAISPTRTPTPTPTTVHPSGIPTPTPCGLQGHIAWTQCMDPDSQANYEHIHQGIYDANCIVQSVHTNTHCAPSPTTAFTNCHDIARAQCLTECQPPNGVCDSRTNFRCCDYNGGAPVEGPGTSTSGFNLFNAIVNFFKSIL